MLISPTEPAALRARGQVSMLSERYGCDILISAPGRMIGIQRKEVSDLLGSVEDGRLAEQVHKMAGLDIAMLIIEGRWGWTNDGQLPRRYGRDWTRAQVQALLWSVQDEGIWVEHTDSLTATIETVERLDEWARKEHKTLRSRGTGPKGVWGTRPDDLKWGAWLIQSLPGVGPELAGRIVSKLGLCIGWTVTKDELMSVEGIGERKADVLMRALMPRSESGMRWQSSERSSGASE